MKKHKRRLEEERQERIKKSNPSQLLQKSLDSIDEIEENNFVEDKNFKLSEDEDDDEEGQMVFEESGMTPKKKTSLSLRKASTTIETNNTFKLTKQQSTSSKPLITLKSTSDHHQPILENQESDLQTATERRLRAASMMSQ